MVATCRDKIGTSGPTAATPPLAVNSCDSTWTGVVSVIATGVGGAAASNAASSVIVTRALQPP